MGNVQTLKHNQPFQFHVLPLQFLDTLDVIDSQSFALSAPAVECVFRDTGINTCQWHSFPICHVQLNLPQYACYLFRRVPPSPSHCYSFLLQNYLALLLHATLGLSTARCPHAFHTAPRLITVFVSPATLGQGWYFISPAAPREST